MTSAPITCAADWAALFRARAAELGRSHIDIECAAKLQPGYLSKILTGRKTPTVATVARICAALEITVNVDALGCVAEQPRLP